MRYLKAAPSGAIAAFEADAARYELSEEQRRIAMLLVTDERMSEAWSKLAATYDRDRWFTNFMKEGADWGQMFFMTVLFRYQTATHPEPWDLMTRGEQAKWLDELDRLVDGISLHLKSAPLKADSLASYIPHWATSQWVLPRYHGHFR